MCFVVKAIDVRPKHKNSYVKISLATSILVKEEDSRKLDHCLSDPVDSMKSLSLHPCPPQTAR